MKIELNACLFKEKDYDGLYDSLGNPISIDDIIKAFPNRKDEMVRVYFTIDDFHHEQEPYNDIRAKELKKNKKKFIYCLCDGRPVKMLTENAQGNYPFIGLDPSNNAYKWNKYGKCETGKPEHKLYIHVENDYDPKKELEEYDAEREGRKPADAPADAAAAGGAAPEVTDPQPTENPVTDTENKAAEEVPVSTGTPAAETPASGTDGNKPDTGITPVSAIDEIISGATAPDAGGTSEE